MVSLPLDESNTFFSAKLKTHLTGNYHTVIVCPEDQRAIGEQVITWVQRRAVQLEGTVTGEHGIGLKLRDALINEVGEEAVNMMRRVSGAVECFAFAECFVCFDLGLI